MASYRKNAKLPFYELDGKLHVDLPFDKPVKELMSSCNVEWVEVEKINLSCFKQIPTTSAVYIFTLYDTETKFNDVAYIGACENIQRRMLSHSRVYQLKNLHERYSLRLFYTLTEKYQLLERDYIHHFLPFLNIVYNYFYHRNTFKKYGIRLLKAYNTPSHKISRVERREQYLLKKQKKQIQNG